MSNNLLNCKNCPFYSGVQCHGHGEYWSSCNAVNQLRLILSKSFDVSKYDIRLKGLSSTWSECLNDDSICILFYIEDRNK